MILGQDVLSNPDLRLKLKNASFLKWQSNEDDQARFQVRVVGVLDEGLKVNNFRYGVRALHFFRFNNGVKSKRA